MFCPNCGAQIPDGSQFCMQCGTTIPANIQPMQPQGAIPQPMQSQPVQPQPMQPNAGVQKPGFGSQPAYGSAQPSYIPSQPMQPQGVIPQPMQPNAGAQQPGFNSQPAYGSVQPSYIPPSNYAPFTQVKKSNTPIIVACCAAVVVVAVVLVLVLVLNSQNGNGVSGMSGGSGVSGVSLEHRWSYTGDGGMYTYDFKNNKISAMGEEIALLEWKEVGNNRILMTITQPGPYGSDTFTEYFTYELSPDGKTLTMTDEDGYPQIFTRAD